MNVFLSGLFWLFSWSFFMPGRVRAKQPPTRLHEPDLLPAPRQAQQGRALLPVSGRNLAPKAASHLALRREVFARELQGRQSQPVSTKDPKAGRLNAKLNTLRTAALKTAVRAEVDGVPLTPELLRAGPGSHSPTAVTAPAFYAQWQADKPGQTPNSARRYKQVVYHLQACHDWPVLEPARKDLLDYLGHLAGLGLVDNTCPFQVLATPSKQW